MNSSATLLEVVGLKKHFQGGTGKFQDFFLRKHTTVKALDGVDLRINKGESFGIVGESGCGKSTLGRTVLRLLDPTEGKIVFKGTDITNIPQKEMRNFRKNMQLVLQNPYSSLNPRKKIKDIISETLGFHGFDDRTERTKRVIQEVGLKLEHLERYPHELSGGQRQRVAIARAISIEPEFVVLDEVTSSLDVSVQAQIINLLLELKEKLGLSYMFISHDLAIVKHMCDKVAVMYLGKIVEEADAQSIFSDTLHPYTKSLVSSIPSPEVESDWKPTLPRTEIETSLTTISGCRFNPRCPFVFERCKVEEPELSSRGSSHAVSCHLYHSGGENQKKIELLKEETV
ncbi:MAG TPA: ABC transporter ATP-binding protein [Nitrososphaerales archaeon]|nr:ABC transporter ATP-binding protein [Nitrososphaerales archaeon]